MLPFAVAVFGADLSSQVTGTTMVPPVVIKCTTDLEQRAKQTGEPHTQSQYHNGRIETNPNQMTSFVSNVDLHQ